MNDTSASHPSTLHPLDSDHTEAAQKRTPVVSDPDHVGVPGGPSDRLQDVLPEISHLAIRVGGMKRLAEIVSSLVPGSER